MFLWIIFCRVFQFVFNYGAKVLPWRKAEPVEGPGSISKIPELLNRHNAKKPMLVTDNGLVKAGIAQKLIDVLTGANVSYVLYSDVEPNPSVNTVNKIQKIFLDTGCDSFVALGGGSSMDAAKGAAARVARPGRTVNQLGGLLKVLKRIPLFIAVPTTAGTGSETTIAALITDTDTHHKYALMDLSLIPRYAILDPELTVGLPPALSAATGMDALTHAVEAYLCWTYSTKESTQDALDAVKIIFENLEKAYSDGSNIQARQNMLLASYKAGFAFTRAGVGNIHAIAHTLGGLYNVPHGLANAIILPKVLQDYGKKVHKKLARLSEQAGLVPAGSKMPNAQKASIFIDAIFAMNRRMGIPDYFTCIKDEDIPQMIKWAGKESNPIYPVPVIYGKKRFRRMIESLQRKTFRITENCTGCTACAKLCPVGAITGELNSRHAINDARCIACGVCGRICQKEAITDSMGKICAPVKRAMWPKPAIDTQICSACSICVNDCAQGALRISLPKEKGDIKLHAELHQPQKCTGCSVCEKHCPLKAIKMEA